jgi:hypothetical protein
MKNGRGNTMLLTLAALALAAGLAASAQALAQDGKRNVTTTGLIPVDVTVFNPATNETVHFAGDVRFVAHTRFNSDGTVTVSVLCNEMIASDDGGQGRLQFQDIHRFTFDAKALASTVSVLCNERLRNPGSCNDVVVPMMLEITIAANGTVSAKYLDGGGGDQFPGDE